MARNWLPFFAIFEHDLLILNELNGERLAKKCQNFLFRFFRVFGDSERE